MHHEIKNVIAAAALLASLATSASAAIIYRSGQEVPIPTTFAGVSVNLETLATSNDVAGAPGAHMNFALGGAGISNDADQTSSAPTWQPVRTGTNNTDPVDNLSIGTIVDSNSVFASDFGGSVSHFLPFVNGTQGYIGFSVVLADSTLAYGWAQVTLQNDNTPGVIHSWAYEDTGAQIEVGAIPEPSHSLLAILGLATLALRRRR